jgi:hypothetical protein
VTTVRVTAIFEVLEEWSRCSNPDLKHEYWHTEGSSGLEIGKLSGWACGL